MKKRGRVIFFWSLAALFLIVAPYVVFRAKGYRFDFDRGVFVYSGIISVKSNPQKIDLYVDGELEDSDINRINGSLNITNLMPREYNLTVKADGFQEWSKRVRVRSGLATEFWNVILIKNNYEKKEHSSGDVSSFFISPKNDFVACTQNLEGGAGVKILDIEKNTISEEFEIPEMLFDFNSREENIEWSPEGNYLSLPVKKATETNDEDYEQEFIYLILQLGEKEIISLNELLGKEKIKNVRWDPREKNYLFFLSKNSLFRANISKAEDLTLIAEDVSSFDLSQNAIYYSQIPKELVFKANLDGQGNREQLTTDFPQELSQPNEKLIVYDKSRIAFLNQDKNLFLYNNEDGKEKVFKKIGERIKGMQFSDDGKKLLYWSENEIFTYFLRDWNVQPTRLANENSSVTRFSEKIRNVQWFKDYEHVIFNVGNGIKIIELDPRDKRNLMDLVAVSNPEVKAVYNNSLELIFFTDNKADGSSLYSIAFPEKTTFLGL